MTPRRSVVLSTTARGLTPVLVLVSVFVTFRGHNAPGGGFAGGLLMGTVVVLRYLADGPTAVERLRIDPVALIGTGLLLAVAVAVAPLLAGEDLLESAIWTWHVPAVGTVKLVSSALFDLGVFLLVVGVVLTTVTALVRADDDSGGTLPGGHG